MPRKYFMTALVATAAATLSLQAGAAAKSAAPAKATPAAAAVPAVGNQLLAAQSEVRFTAKQMGVPMPGMFSKLAGSVQWNAAKPESCHIRLEVPVASATVGAPEMDAELPKAEWFAASQFPTAVFESSSVRALGGNRFEVQGSLSIKGVRLPVKTEATVTSSGATSLATGQLSIARLAYNIGLGAWGNPSVVADPVQVQYRIRLKNAP